MLNFFVSGEAMSAGDALAAAANRGSFARRAGIDHFVILTTAFGAAHKSTANCGRRFCTIQIVGASRVSNWLVKWSDSYNARLTPLPPVVLDPESPEKARFWFDRVYRAV
jgi:hypothetical protein